MWFMTVVRLSFPFSMSFFSLVCFRMRTQVKWRMHKNLVCQMGKPIVQIVVRLSSVIDLHKYRCVACCLFCCCFKSLWYVSLRCSTAKFYVGHCKNTNNSDKRTSQKEEQKNHCMAQAYFEITIKRGSFRFIVGHSIWFRCIQSEDHSFSYVAILSKRPLLVYAKTNRISRKCVQKLWFSFESDTGNLHIYCTSESERRCNTSDGNRKSKWNCKLSHSKVCAYSSCALWENRNWCPPSGN